MNITYLKLENLRPAPWRTTYVLKPDMKLLKASLQESGWLAPLVVMADGTIIDGFHRWVAAQDPVVEMVLGDDVPVIVQDLDEVDAMVLHVRMNRARGEIRAKPFSDLVRAIVDSGRYEDTDLKALFSMSYDEVLLMLDGMVVDKKLAEHAYSRAWVPVEAPPAGAKVAKTITIERPPNADK